MGGGLVRMAPLGVEHDPGRQHIGIGWLQLDGPVEVGPSLVKFALLSIAFSPSLVERAHLPVTELAPPVCVCAVERAASLLDLEKQVACPQRTLGVSIAQDAEAVFQSTIVVSKRVESVLSPLKSIRQHSCTHQCIEPSQGQLSIELLGPCQIGGGLSGGSQPLMCPRTQPQQQRDIVTQLDRASRSPRCAETVPTVRLDSLWSAWPTGYL